MLELIKINQQEIYCRGRHEQTDVIGWMIIQYLQFVEKNTKKVRKNGSYYHRVHLQKLIHGLPMSGLKTEGGMCKRLQKLADQRLVAFFRTSNNQLYFRLGYTARNISQLTSEHGDSSYDGGGVVIKKNYKKL